MHSHFVGGASTTKALLVTGCTPRNCYRSGAVGSVPAVPTPLTGLPPRWADYSDSRAVSLCDVHLSQPKGREGILVRDTVITWKGAFVDCGSLHPFCVVVIAQSV